MTDRPPHVERQWAEAMFADLQHQIDDLTTQVAALTNLVHAHTMATLNPSLVQPEDHHG